MTSSGHRDDGAALRPEDALRLRWLTAPEDADGAEVLRRALQQAVAALGGLGGLAHLSGEEADSLYLAAVHGVPAEIARRWETVDKTSDLAPSAAADRRNIVWSTSWPGDDSGEEAAGLGVLSVPLVADGISIGALSVLTCTPPEPERREFLLRLGGVVGDRLPTARRWISGTTPWWQEPLRPRMMREMRVGAWSWDLASGLLDYDHVIEDLVAMTDLDADRWDRHIATWMEQIHPDDRPGVDRAIERSFTDGTPYAVEYRVVNSGGRIGWVELRANFETNTSGEKVRMVGTAMDVTARRSRESWLVSLLELHPDPHYVVDASNRVAWANRAASAAAEAAGISLIGRPVPDTMAGLMNRARATSGTAVTMMVDIPQLTQGGSGAREVRAVEVEGYVAAQVADVAPGGS
ncbi:PAS domain S-box-containing protein [Actinacidiphila alni]|uniref:histidine kinase n=1 Tax=Actinacidiphila alni TaxID=380248 RepID=A0A1I2L5D5_9ACTN|nr:PAS domain-containing protein [Actinacidiphila alni]SFF74564.1 PAS domain S-box-containing protein [Actinacidiphila alni]